MKTIDTEALVLGAGPGGYETAIRLEQYGIDTTLVDHGNPGGVCLNWGCIPSKALIHASNVFEDIQHADQLGIDVGSPSIDMPDLVDWKDRIVTKLTRGVEHLMNNSGVDVVYGHGSFIASNELAVTREGDSDLTVKFDNAIVASGSSPIELPGFSFDGEHLLSSRDILELEEVPENLVLIGGGVIGLELGTVFAKFGANVTVVEVMDQLLPGTDPDLVKVVRKKLEDLGVNIYLESSAEDIIEKRKYKYVQVNTPDGEEEIQAEKVLMCVGREPNTDELGLENTDVELNEDGFIQTDLHQRTTDEHIFAIGDVAGPPLLAHKASSEGLAVAGALAGKSTAADFQAIPGVIFTDPEIAETGMSVEEAEEQGYNPVVGTFPLQASGRAMTTNSTEGLVKVIADKETDIVLGVKIASDHASELITEGTLAIEMAATVEDLTFAIHPHPTLSESVLEAAEDVHDLSIHKP